MAGMLHNGLYNSKRWWPLPTFIYYFVYITHLQIEFAKAVVNAKLYQIDPQHYSNISSKNDVFRDVFSNSSLSFQIKIRA